MEPGFPLADPTLADTAAPRVEQVTVLPAFAETPPGTRADLDRFNIAVVLQAIYEWGGYRYSNASDAIAAAKRAAR